MERLRDLYLLGRRDFVKMLSVLGGMVFAPQILRRRKRRIRPDRLGKPGSPLEPVIQRAGVVGSWPSYAGGY
jgi:hypothetical protein